MPWLFCGLSGVRTINLHITLIDQDYANSWSERNTSQLGQAGVIATLRRYRSLYLDRPVVCWHARLEHQILGRRSDYSCRRSARRHRYRQSTIQYYTQHVSHHFSPAPYSFLNPFASLENPRPRIQHNILHSPKYKISCILHMFCQQFLNMSNPIISIPFFPTSQDASPISSSRRIPCLYASQRCISRVAQPPISASPNQFKSKSLNAKS